MFNELMGTLEIVFYVFLVLLPIIIFSQLFIRLKNKFFNLKAWEFSLKQEMIMLEIKNPKEITKTPEAMEVVLSSFYNASKEGSWFDKTWNGQSRPVYSLEIVSIDGHVRLYIRARKALKKLIESSFYAQYPTIEINEVPDYIKYFDYEKEAAGGIFGVEYSLSKADPIPIKTYKQFGLDKSGLDAENIIDPMSTIIEMLGNIGEGENFWLQFVIRGQKKDHVKKLSFWKNIFGFKPEVADWKYLAEEEISKMKEALMDENGDGVKFQKVTTDKEKKIIDSIIENVNKPSYWVGIRTIYFAEDGKFDPQNINPTLALFQALNSDEFNKFKIAYNTGFDFAWQDPSGERATKMKKDIFLDYKRRKFFNVSGKEKKVWPKKRYNTFVLSVEELATVFHPPSAATATPNFERIDSKKGEAPMNLPI